MMFDYFDDYFSKIEEILGNSMNDVLSSTKPYAFTYLNDGGSFEQLSSKVFDQMYSSLLIDLFPDAGMYLDTSVFSASPLHKDSEDYKKAYEFKKSLPQLSAHIDGTLYEKLMYEQELWEKFIAENNIDISDPLLYALPQSNLDKTFDKQFFKDIAPEGGTEWDGFVRLAETVKNTDNFLERFNTQMETTDMNAVRAFEIFEAIQVLMEGIRGSVNSVMKGTDLTNELSVIDEQFKNLNQTLKNLNATTEELTEAERARHLLLGTIFTGFTATNLQSGMAGDENFNVRQLLSNSLIDSMASTAAESIMTQFLEPISVAAGKVWDETGSIEAVFAEIEKHDLSGAQSAINDFNDSIRGLREEAEESSDALQKTFGGLLAQAYRGLGEEDLATGVEHKMTLMDLEDVFHPLQKFIWSLEDAEESVGKWSDSLDNIQKTIDSIMTDNELPQSRVYMEDRYATLLAQAQSDPDKVADYTGFATQYLDFLKDYGDPRAVEKVLRDLMGLEATAKGEVSMAESITGGKTLADLYKILEDIPDDIKDMFFRGPTLKEWWNDPANDIARIFEEALAPIKKFLETLGFTFNFTLPGGETVTQTANPISGFFQTIDSVIRGVLDPNGTGTTTGTSTAGSTSTSTSTETSLSEHAQIVEDLYVKYFEPYQPDWRNEPGHISGMEYWKSQLDSGALTPSNIEPVFYDSVKRDWPIGHDGDPYPGLASFKIGGTIYGPETGYTIPTTFHGIEHIVPNQEMQDVKALLQYLVANVKGTDSDSDIEVKVYIGERELTEITRDIIRTDPGTHEEIHRVTEK
jgi:hypothetical protein